MSRYIKIVNGRKQASDTVVEVDGTGKIPIEVIPDGVGGGSISVYSVDSIETRDALTSVYEGDICFIEGDYTYIYDGEEWNRINATGIGGIPTASSDLETHFWLSF